MSYLNNLIPEYFKPIYGYGWLSVLLWIVVLIISVVLTITGCK